jgi:hypothetical protein
MQDLGGEKLTQSMAVKPYIVVSGRLNVIRRLKHGERTNQIVRTGKVDDQISNPVHRH